MSIWKCPIEEPPVDVFDGDRVLILVRERLQPGGPIEDRLVVLEAREHGWRACDDYYAGYEFHDGILWAKEAEALKLITQTFLESCPKDTDNDGDCEQCHRYGGCPNNR